MSGELRHSVVGLPESGKTTFLAALWHLVTSDEIGTALVLRSTRGNTEYLEAIAGDWRRCRPMERTRMGATRYVTLELTEADTAVEFDLCFPDMAGETFDAQLAARELDGTHAEWLDHPGGTLLFLSAIRGPDGQRLEDLRGMLDPESPSDAVDGTSTTSTISAWRPETMPEQAKLVELLQSVRRLDPGNERRAVAVVVSAWDAVADEGRTPLEWLRAEKPLLAQFLKANGTALAVRFYGVSAQGGHAVRDREALLDKSLQSERIRCVEVDRNGAVLYDGSDLTKPIVWLNRAGSAR